MIPSASSKNAEKCSLSQDGAAAGAAVEAVAPNAPPALDPDLLCIASVWHQLAPHLRAAILTLVHGSS